MYDEAIDKAFKKEKKGKAPPEPAEPAPKEMEVEIEMGGEEPSLDDLMEVASPEERKILEALKAKCGSAKE